MPAETQTAVDSAHQVFMPRRAAAKSLDKPLAVPMIQEPIHNVGPHRGRCRGCEVLLDKGIAGTLRPWGRPANRRPQDAPQHCGDTALQGNPSIPQGLPPAIVAHPPQAGAVGPPHGNCAASLRPGHARTGFRQFLRQGLAQEQGEWLPVYPGHNLLRTFQSGTLSGTPLSKRLRSVGTSPTGVSAGRKSLPSFCPSIPAPFSGVRDFATDSIPFPPP